MNLLVLSDLHYDHQQEVSRKKLKLIQEERDLDAIVLAGDNAELTRNLRNHHILIESLQSSSNCPLAFVVGNHELWGKEMGLTSGELLSEAFNLLSRRYGLTYLEKENLKLGDLTIAGTYGHYDYSLFTGEGSIMMKDIILGKLRLADKVIVWRDKTLMNWENLGDPHICKGLIEDFEERVSQGHGPKISISHTIPKSSLQGWPKSPLQDFFSAYSGTTLLGKVIEKSDSAYHFCGHTHGKANDLIGKTKVINLGSDYKILRYVLVSYEDAQFIVNEREFDLR